MRVFTPARDLEWTPGILGPIRNEENVAPGADIPNAATTSPNNHAHRPRRPPCKFHGNLEQEAQHERDGLGSVRTEMAAGQVRRIRFARQPRAMQGNSVRGQGAQLRRLGQKDYISEGTVGWARTAPG